MKSAWSWLKKPLFWVVSPLVILAVLAWLYRRYWLPKTKEVVSTAVTTVEASTPQL